jgi:hypothetical protein
MVVSALRKHRRLLVMLPRQEGKTEIGIRMIRDMMDTDQMRQCMFLAKSKESAKKASREKFQRLFSPLEFKVNGSEVINKANPSAVCFIQSVDKDPDRIRGGTYHFIHWSEVAFSHFEKGATVDDVVSKIILPAQRKTNGFLYLESTPNGKNGWKQLWDNARGIFGAHTLRVSLSMLVEMGLCSRAEYDRIRGENHPLVFDQEYECMFVNFAGLMYPELADRMIYDFEPPQELGIVGAAIDWGFRDACCMLAAYKYKGKLWIFDEIYGREMLLSDFSDKFKSHIEAWGARGLQAVADHEPDRIEELQRRGIPCGNANKVDVLGNRVQIKELLHFDKIRIHPRCQYLIKDLQSATWHSDVDSKREDIDQRNCDWGHYDAEAAFRYLIRELSNIPETKETLIDFSGGLLA